MKEYGKLKSWLEENHGNLINDILKLLKINSESYERKEVDKALNEVLSIAERLGFHTELRANGEVGVIFFGDGDETLGILTHVDVVPVGDVRLWTHSPFGEIFDGKIYGRGIVDNKGMVISCLYALAAIKSLNLPVYKKTELIVGTREEIVWTDLELYRKEGHPIPDYGFTPDGEFPIINREKGNCELLLTFDNDSCEGSFELLEILSGAAVNSVPGLAKAKIKGDRELIIKKIREFNNDYINTLEYELSYENEILITCFGKEAHSSVPQFGDNALVKLCVFLSQFKFNDNGVNSSIKFIKDNFNENIFGEVLGLPVHPEYRNDEEMGKTTITPTLCSYNNGIEVYLSIRTVYGTIKEEIANTFNSLSSKYNFKYLFHDILDPLYVPRNHKFIDILAKVYEFNTKEKAEFILAGGTSYAKALPNIVAFGPVFPKAADVAHQVDEYITIEDLVNVTKIYTMVVAEALLNNDSLK